MSILCLPSELLMFIAQQLECNDLNAFLQIHPSIYHTLNDYLYYCNVQYHDSSALFWAAIHGSQKTLERILYSGADIRWNSDYWKLAKPWSKRAPYLKRPASGLREHPISYAASNGHIEVLRTLLREGADINFKDGRGRSPLALAARNGHFTLVKALISLGASQLSYNGCGQRPIADAASEGHDDIADYLLQELKKYRHFYPKSTIQSEIQWLLLYAAKRGDLNRIKYLVSIGADVNFQFKFNCSTPLYGAVAFAPSPLGVVKLLLELGADPNISKSPSTRGHPGNAPRLSLPLHHAIKREESFPLIKLLLEYGANAYKASWALTMAVNLEKPAEFRLLVEYGANIYVSCTTKSLFKRALESTCEDIRNVILEQGITAETPDPITPEIRRRQKRS